MERDQQPMRGQHEDHLEHCVVCDRPVEGERHVLGGRYYCDEHFARATMGSRGTWPSMVAMVLGLVALAFVMIILGDDISERVNHTALIAIGLAMAIIPALLWLGVFSRLDRLEPEPHAYLLSVMIIAAIATAGIAEPIRTGILRLQDWQPENNFYALAVIILTEGAMFALIVYLTVRYTAYLTDEFDERADGVIYGTAAGLGIGIALGFVYVIEQGGVNLDVGAARIIIQSLALAAIGGVVGYGLGQVKFEHHVPFYVGIFGALGAVLFGVLDWLLSEVTLVGLGLSAWRGVAIAGIFAAMIFAALFGLLRHAVQETLKQSVHTPVSVAEA
jgi:RsiW-degrading membrane proteinase PrsW (M82 family)